MDTDPLWTARSLVTNKEAVVRVTRDWLAAGARVVLTASYQVSADLFREQLGLSRQQTWDHVVDSVGLAWRAVQEEGGVRGHTLVGGSVGPYGACLHDGSADGIVTATRTQRGNQAFVIPTGQADLVDWKFGVMNPGLRYESHYLTSFSRGSRCAVK